MKKKLILFGIMAIGFVNAQTTGRNHPQHTSGKHRVGINTDTPVATLEVSKTTVPAGQVQGFMIPHLSQAERNAMTQAALVQGLQIFNTDKNCVDWWNGTTWQCMDGTLQDNHGTNPAFIEDDTFTDTRVFYKNNCPAGQQPKAGISFTGTGSGRGYSSISQQDAKNKAKEAARLDYLRKGQEHANTNGVCETAPVVPPTDPISILDPTLKLGNTKYWFSSIKDDDYIGAGGKVIMPTDIAAWGDLTPTGDGVKEPKALDVQGVIPALNSMKNNAIKVAIPIATAPSANMILPPFTTYMEIPAEYTEDGRKGVVILTWESTSINTTTSYFIGHIYAQGTEDIKLKKLDLAKGMGNDHMGLSLGVMKYPINSSDNDPTMWQGELNLRLISGIPDRKFDHYTTIDLTTEKRHEFIYVPTITPNGKMVLGNNLGANYANIHHIQFNPGQQAKNATDHHAYGSLGQWGKAYDGYELMNWVGLSFGNPVYSSSFLEASALTQFYENCPAGWHTPTKDDIDAVFQSISRGAITDADYRSYFSGGLRMPFSGYRADASVPRYYFVGSIRFLWSSTTHASYPQVYYWGDSGATTSPKTNGYPTRCMKN